MRFQDPTTTLNVLDSRLLVVGKMGSPPKNPTAAADPETFIAILFFF
jgi:hypothetical protein